MLTYLGFVILIGTALLSACALGAHDKPNRSMYTDLILRRLPTNMRQDYIGQSVSRPMTRPAKMKVATITTARIMAGSAPTRIV